MGRFRDALSQPGLGAIAEVKRRSPSAGDLRPDAIPPSSLPPSKAPALQRCPSRRRAFRGKLGRSARRTGESVAPAPRQRVLFDWSAPPDGEDNGADAVLLLLRDLDEGKHAS